MSGQLKGYLLRTLCTDASNLALSYVAGVPTDALSTQKATDAAIKNLSAESGKAFQCLFTSLSAKNENLEDFFSALYEVSGPGICALNLKAPDKKTKYVTVRGCSRITQLRFPKLFWLPGDKNPFVLETWTPL